MGKITDRLKYLKFSDFKHVFLFLFAVPVSWCFKRKHKELWLICEDGSMARDNGYWLFRYLCENHKEIDCAYVISKKSPDFDKVSNLGKIVYFKTFTHWIYYLAAKYNISSTKLGKPSTAVCFPLEQVGVLKTKRVFLQHGITKDDMKTLYYDVCKFSLFTTSTKKEYDFVENNFGYKDKDIVKLTGLTRFDNLINKSDCVKKNQILLMPTWRDWLGNASLKTSDQVFKNSDYYKTYQSLINNKHFIELLERYNLQFIFFPHKAMQQFIGSFSTENPNIIIADWHKYDVQNLLIESALCITDYSSIAMDFAYLEKPLIYYQFDYEKFRASHYHEGYFSYENDGFGHICKTEDEILLLLDKYIQNGFLMEEEYLNRVHSFFTLHDNKNCERTYEEIKKL